MCAAFDSTAGTIWMPLEPFPITAKRLFCHRCESGNPVRMVRIIHTVQSNPSSHLALWSRLPRKFCSPGMLGHFQSFNAPVAEKRTSQLSVYVRSFSRSSIYCRCQRACTYGLPGRQTFSSHFDTSAFHLASVIFCFSLMYLMQSYFSTTRFQYRWISLAVA